MIPRFRPFVAFLLLFILALGLTPLLGRVGQAAASDPQAKIAPDLWQTIQRDGQAGFIAILGEQANTSLAASQPTKLAKGQFVYDALRSTAERTQSGLRAYLTRQGVAFTPYYIVNAIYIEAGKDVLQAVAARSEVQRLVLNEHFQAINPIIEPAPVQPAAPTTIEWNLTFINVDDVWSQYGVTGQGAVIGDLDTGVDWDHPALKNAYRGWNGTAADHNYNWWDATTNGGVNAPYDDHSHGTHTTGTVVGYDPAQDKHIGVAPGAKWVACKNMDAGGSGQTAWFITCFEFALAPWNLNHQNPNPALAPDVVNNSWRYWGGGNNAFYTAIQNLRNAGVVVEVSAGNEGPNCTTLGSPSDYNNVFTTGATAYHTETLVSFSSRGPSILYPTSIKPDIVAPGQNINSSLPGGGYSGETWSGTSMAGPHVVGAVALLVSANPSLHGQVSFMEDVLRNTTYRGMPDPPNPDSCGGIAYNVVPNHIYGWGRLDTLMAVTSVIGDVGYVEGHVYDQVTGNPITGVVVDFGNNRTTTTDSSGRYFTALPEGTYSATAGKYGWLSDTASGIVVVIGETATQDFTLTPAAQHLVYGKVTNQVTGRGVGAHIELFLNGSRVVEAYSGGFTGRYRMRAFDGTYTLTASATGYATYSQTLVVDGNEQVNIQLIPALESGQ